MSEMTDKARAHITEQALKINSNFATFIEEHLTEMCKTDAIAEKLLDPDKPLNEFCKDCRDKAKEIARKRGSGIQIEGLPDSEYYSMVEEYYGINKLHNDNSNIIDLADFI